MATSKWLDELTEMWDWMEADESQDLQDLVFRPTVTRVVQKKDSKSKSAKKDGNGQQEIPEILPILPLRGVVVYPQTGVPLTVGQPRSVRLVDDAVSSKRLVGLVASRDPEKENPGPEDLYPVGTVGEVHRCSVHPMARFDS